MEYKVETVRLSNRLLDFNAFSAAKTAVMLNSVWAIM